MRPPGSLARSALAVVIAALVLTGAPPTGAAAPPPPPNPSDDELAAATDPEATPQEGLPAPPADLLTKRERDLADRYRQIWPWLNEEGAA